MTNMKKIFLSLMVGATLMSTQQAEAGGRHSHGRPRSNHYHGHRPVHRVYHQPRVVHRHYYRPYRPVYYRPYYQPRVVAHYHMGFMDPCYDTLHTTGVYWNVNVGNGGWGVGFESGW